MNWKNLKKRLCPVCEEGALYKKILADELTYMMRCDECMFMLTQETFEYRVAILKDEDYVVHEVDDNLTYLNNLY